VLGTPQHRAQALRRHNHLERRFHGRMGRGIARPHWRYGYRPGVRRYGRSATAAPHVAHGRHGVARGVTPGTTTTTSVGTTGVRPGRIVGGQCTCTACPASGPAYCRCCGQVLR
jgi:hypothetical protein